MTAESQYYPRVGLRIPGLGAITSRVQERRDRADRFRQSAIALAQKVTERVDTQAHGQGGSDHKLMVEGLGVMHLAPDEEYVRVSWPASVSNRLNVSVGQAVTYINKKTGELDAKLRVDRLEYPDGRQFNPINFNPLADPYSAEPMRYKDIALKLAQDDLDWLSNVVSSEGTFMTRQAFPPRETQRPKLTVVPVF